MGSMLEVCSFAVKGSVAYLRGIQRSEGETPHKFSESYIVSCFFGL